MKRLFGAHSTRAPPKRDETKTINPQTTGANENSPGRRTDAAPVFEALAAAPEVTAPAAAEANEVVMDPEV